MLEPQTFFGQLQHIFVIRLKASPVVGLSEDTTLILAAIRACADAKLKAENNIYYYSREGHLKVVDMECVQCPVGRCGCATFGISHLGLCSDSLR
jgi:hypothetical protein